MEGTVRAENRSGGGLSIGFDVPTVSASAATAPADPSPAHPSPARPSAAQASPIDRDALYMPPPTGTAATSAPPAIPPAGA